MLIINSQVLNLIFLFQVQCMENSFGQDTYCGWHQIEGVTLSSKAGLQGGQLLWKLLMCQLSKYLRNTITTEHYHCSANHYMSYWEILKSFATFASKHALES